MPDAPLAPVLHDLALLYLSLAYGADGQLDEEEIMAMRRQLRTWAPGENPALLDHVLREAKLTYTNGMGGERLSDLITRLHSTLSAAERERVLADLRALAEADREVRPEEVVFVDRLAQEWGF